jgi:hypothetical protein
LQVVPPTAYHAQFSVEQRAAYNLARAYLALAPQPSVPSGEAVAWGLADANGYLRGAKLYRGNLPEAKRDLESALNIELHEVPLYAAPPQERVSEVTEAMVEAGYVAMYRTMNEFGPIASTRAARAILTAALSAGRADD